MSKFMQRTQRHKSNNTAGKHSSRLRFSNGAAMIIIILIILGVMKWA